MERRNFGLTAREEEVARLALTGLTRREIAFHLCVTENCVKVHLSHIYDKVGVRNRVELLNALRPPPRPTAMIAQ